MADPGLVSVQVNEQQLAAVAHMLRDIPRGMEKVLTRAINKVGIAARTRVLRMITQTLTLKQKDLRGAAGRLHQGDTVKLRRASFRRLFATLRVVGGRIPLLAFSARQTKKGVSYKIRRDGPRQKIRSAFITKVGGHTGVFKRLGRPRFPIQELWGPSVPLVLLEAPEFARGSFETLMAQRLHKEIAVQLELMLQKHGRGTASVV